MAIVAIAIALGITALVGQIVEFNLFVTNIISMIGLAVGIDYSLFIVSRFREERKKGFEKLDAIGAAGATANRAVFFSGMTVVLALLGMFIIPTTIFRALAAGAIFVTVVSIVVVDDAAAGDPRQARRPDQLAASVQARAPGHARTTSRAGSGTSDLAGRDDATVGLPDRERADPRRPGLVLLPAEQGQLDEHQPAARTCQRRRRSSRWSASSPVGSPIPAEIIVTGRRGHRRRRRRRSTKLQDEIAQNPAFSPETQVATSEDGTAVEVSAYFKGETQNDAVVRGDQRSARPARCPRRSRACPASRCTSAGQSAIFLDFLHVTDSYQWIVLAFVLGLSFLLLMVVFRSLVLPIKAIIMNLLSVGAAYGAVTLVFQKGVGIGFFNAIGFNFHQSEAIEAWLPLFLFSILFGLSMDYHVFLLTRIREEYDKTHDNTEAVAYGLRTTAGIITGAAIIMVVVFTGFASGRLGPLQQMGFGLAVAVFMDATIVRTFLVPARMRLLGDWNWYLPGWLEWLPQLHVEGHEPEHDEPVTVPDTPAELIEKS